MRIPCCVLKLRLLSYQNFTRFPAYVHGPVTCTRFPSHNSLSLNNDKMVDEQAMQKALAEIESSLDPNIAEITRKHNLERSTLSRRLISKTTSRAEFLSRSH